MSDFLVYSVFDCCGLGVLTPFVVSTNFDVNVFGLQLFRFADFIKPYGCDGFL
jgi:hypothetical protein